MLNDIVLRIIKKNLKYILIVHVIILDNNSKLN